jgi:hypothetical protein
MRRSAAEPRQARNLFSDASAVRWPDIGFGDYERGVRPEAWHVASVVPAV